MTEHVERVASASLAALKFVSMGGPVAVAMGGAGGLIVALAVNAPNDTHADAYMVVGGILLVLGFVEWALARRFARHEQVEARDREALGHSLLDQGAMNLRTVLSQVESVGAQYDRVAQDVRSLVATADQRGPRLDSLEATVSHLGVEVDEIKTWRARIGDRLGTLR